MADLVTKDNYPVKGVQGFVSRPLSERFWRYVVKTDGCWIWIGATASFGYGRIQREGGKHGKTDRAHRVSWLLHYGEMAAKGRSTKRAICGRGHIRTPENVSADRHCKVCRNDRDVARTARRGGIA